jgi:transcriptional regulator with XRE-family HTH domain
MSKRNISLTDAEREVIRLHRLAARLSREKVASAIGRSPRWVARIERGESAIFTPIDLHRMASVLHVRAEDLASN